MYSSLHEAYGWTKKQVDDEELEYIFDLLLVLAKIRDTDDEEDELPFELQF